MIAHPAANAMPPMDDDEFAKLKADIAANGLHNPIEVYQGTIIEGRHRKRACDELGIEDPDTVEVDDFTIGSNPWVYVASLNLKRRHLSKSQIAQAIADLEAAEAKYTKKPSKATAASLAKEHGVSERAVESARVVQAKGSEAVIEAVKDGTIGGGLGEKLVLAMPDHAEQEEVVKEARKATKPAAEVAKRISGGVTFNTEEFEGAEAEPGKKLKNGAPAVATKDRKEAAKLCHALSRSLQKLGVYEEFIAPISQILERIQAL